MNSNQPLIENCTPQFSRKSEDRTAIEAAEQAAEAEHNFSGVVAVPEAVRSHAAGPMYKAAADILAAARNAAAGNHTEAAVAGAGGARPPWGPP